MTLSDLPVGRIETLRFLDDLLVRHPPVEEAIAEVARRLDRVVAIETTRSRAVVACPLAGMTTHWPRDVAVEATPRGVRIALGPPAHPDDPLLIERLAVLAIVLLDREALTVPARSEAEQVALLIDRTASPARRNQALLGLGLHPTTPLRAFTAAGPERTLAAFTAALSATGTRVLATTRARTTVLLRISGVDDIDRLDVPRGLQVSVSRVHPASAAPRARREADGAFRFTQPSPRDRGPYPIEEGVLVRTEVVNGYDILADALTPEQISRIGDVRALDEVLAVGGADMLSTLDVVATGSIRRAARSLRVHHNSVLHRVAQAERLLGFGLNDAYGRNRLFLALTLRRIRQTHGMV
ncbi:PucR C-terminal helix-turn-helix domain-containing protein [Pseudonocardia thermophila]|jgi:Bacterial regulatory helix-turn-helix protein, lysR family.|uniref:PucR C-terminal helix-turn-helix domain-containing protein n=1 Tax=Pseudonocardia thermophila TaxID=1848 RepID=A0A1M6ZBU9_PSETH|nr:helix-turn-helix domain-containing protein [Pseudonocardia thermophila]SHL27996.1 PucR C-terminal helix-turn-helix domain-containing protein [Pseudonocardia thermophila]